MWSGDNGSVPGEGLCVCGEGGASQAAQELTRVSEVSEDLSGVPVRLALEEPSPLQSPSRCGAGRSPLSSQGCVCVCVCVCAHVGTVSWQTAWQGPVWRVALVSEKFQRQRLRRSEGPPELSRGVGLAPCAMKKD